jgi:hypothetical protein
MIAFPARAAVPAIAALMLVVTCLPAVAQDLPRLNTNQQYVEENSASTTLDTADPEAVLGFVLASLPDRVKVYPTENYFYFNFTQGGIKWSGNLRFDVETRDAGKVHMTYFKDFTLWQRDEVDTTVIWDATRGVTVEKIADLVYRVGFRGRSVVFELNDLASVVPPQGAVRDGEKYLGPVFDESGIRFFLVFNPVAGVFEYVLDETVKTPDEFVPVDFSPDIGIGRRTGFAFITDRFSNRKILIGVNAANTGTNNYLDGPFDQLPDNFLKGDELREAILAVSPEMKGTIDRFGNSNDDTVRYLIAPYMQYEEPGELSMFDDCARSEPLPHYYACFSVAPGPANEEDAPAGGDEPGGEAGGDGVDAGQ